MSIGINWAEIWAADVWAEVWAQTATVIADEGPPRGSRVKRSRLTRKAPAKPKAVRKPKRAKLLPPVVIEEPERIVIPPQPALEAYAEKLAPLAPVTGEFKATLQGCSATFKAKVGNSGRFSASLEGVEMEMTAKVQVYDDAISVYMRLPELEPELVDA